MDERRWEKLDAITEKVMRGVVIVFVVSLALAAIGYQGKLGITTTDHSIAISSSFQLGAQEKETQPILQKPSGEPLYQIHVKKGESIIFSKFDEAIIYRTPVISDDIRTEIKGDVSTVIVDNEYERDLWIPGNENNPFNPNQKVTVGFFTKEEALQIGLTQTEELVGLLRKDNSTCSLNSSITRHYGGQIDCKNVKQLFENLD